MNNPLLDFSGLPRFSAIRPEHVGPAVEQLLAEARVAMRAAEKAAPTWEHFVEPLERATERLSRAWGQVEHLHAVLDSPELRSAYNAGLPKITQFWTELGQSQALFEKYRALKDSGEFKALVTARRKLVENALRDFRLGGAELPAEVKPRYAAIQEELASLSAKFSENVLDATNAYSILIEDEKRLAGMPADDLQAAREAARKKAGRAGSSTCRCPPTFR